jgi:hypothetical protein
VPIAMIGSFHAKMPARRRRGGAVEARKEEERPEGFDFARRRRQQNRI